MHDMRLNEFDTDLFEIQAKYAHPTVMDFAPKDVQLVKFILTNIESKKAAQGLCLFITLMYWMDSQMEPKALLVELKQTGKRMKSRY